MLSFFTLSLNCFYKKIYIGQSGAINTRQNRIIVSGNGLDLGNDKALKGRAKRKTITQAMVLSLMDVAKQKGNDKKQYNL